MDVSGSYPVKDQYASFASRTRPSSSAVMTIATGLAWTETGGEILSTEATLMKGKGALTLPLADSGAELHLLEIDRDLAALLQRTLPHDRPRCLGEREVPRRRRGAR